ncbi:MAG: lamin tail domain-containing protein, partial [Nanoarchaeota archaeon]|nr:lamin tail domain-containing protein [Nanoarchaeota archaeon]
MKNKSMRKGFNLFLSLMLAIVMIVPAVSADVVINEIMQNPDVVGDSDGEYLELYNTGDTAEDIDGWTIKDAGTNTHTIDDGGPLTISAEGYLLLCRNSNFAENGGLTCDYEYSSFSLDNSIDEIILEDDLLVEVDRVEYDDGATFPNPSGASMELINYILDNNVGTNWGEATTLFGDGDLGTPGAENSVYEDLIIIENVNHDPEFPTTSDDVEICTTVTGFFEIDNVTLDWDNNDGRSGDDWPMADMGDDLYCLTLSAATLIPADSMDVDYSITAEDEFLNTATTEEYTFTYDGADPIADARPDTAPAYTCDEGDLPITLDGSDSFDTASGITAWQWDFDYDGETFDVDASGETVPYTCLDGDTTPTIALKVIDNIGLEDIDDTELVTINNVAPTAADNTIIIDEDTNHIFIEADFGFVDIVDSLVSVQITTLETVGTLQLSDVDVTLDQVILVADITAGNLVFVPNPNENGAAYDTFGFSVNDGDDDSVASYTMTIDVTADNDAPTAADNTVITLEDTNHTFIEADFGFSDVDVGDALVSVQITTLETVGTLQLSDVDVTLDQVILVADITAGNLVFVPVAGSNGAAYDTFGFSVNDGTVDSVASYTMTIDVTAVNDAPTAADNTVIIDEDTNHTFVEAEFNFADVDVGDALVSVQITTLETVGTLQLSDVDVTLDQVILVADITAGNLVFVPAVDGNGTGYDSFEFTVNDGDDDSVASYTMTVDVTADNDAPVVQTIDDQEVTETREFSLLVIATDPDNEQSELSINEGTSTLPSWLTVNGDNPMLLVGTPENDDLGINTVSIILSDGIDDSAVESFNITVIPALSISNVRVNTVSVTEDETTTNSVKPNEEITVQFTVTNGLDHAITGISAELTTAIAGFTLESEETINLNAETNSQITLTGILPLTTVEGEYNIDLAVEGRDYNDSDIVHSDSFSFSLDVQQDAADVSITNLNLEDEEG